MKFLKYIPSLVFAFIEVAVVAAILDEAGYSNYSDLMAGLALIYASFRSFSLGIVTTINNIVLGLAKDLTDLKEKMLEDYDIDGAKESLKMGAEKNTQTNIKLGIRWLGVCLIYIIGFLSLFD